MFLYAEDLDEKFQRCESGGDRECQCDSLARWRRWDVSRAFCVIGIMYISLCHRSHARQSYPACVYSCALDMCRIFHASKKHLATMWAMFFHSHWFVISDMCGVRLKSSQQDKVALTTWLRNVSIPFGSRPGVTQIMVLNQCCFMCSCTWQFDDLYVWQLIWYP